MSDANPPFVDLTGFPRNGEHVAITDRAEAVLVGLGWEKPDAPDKHILLPWGDPIGGFVCSVCDTPVESEPCEEHQPVAYARCNA